jgi:hypothetical protein
MAEETALPAETTAKPAAAKKPKEPALEDKPFGEFMEQHFTPALKEALAKKGLPDVVLSFRKAPIPAVANKGECWQVIGQWNRGQRQFNLYFLDEDINGQKAFSYGVNGKEPSTLESFMIDERKASLDLMVLYTLQRLNGQKWLSGN